MMANADRLRPPRWFPSAAEKEKLLSFEGYGADAPDVVFVGLEEYCSGQRERQRDSIWLRCTNPAFAERRADKNRATGVLNQLNRPTSPKQRTVPVWNIMAGIMAGITGRDASEELLSLGSRPPTTQLSTLLTELQPLPRPGTTAFSATYIPAWFGSEFRGPRDLTKQATERSASRIRRLVCSSPAPSFIFFYSEPSRRFAKTYLYDCMSKPFASVSSGVEVGRSAMGTAVALTGFYNGQHSATAFRSKDVSLLLKAILAL